MNMNETINQLLAQAASAPVHINAGHAIIELAALARRAVGMVEERDLQLAELQAATVELAPADSNGTEPKKKATTA